MNLYKSRRRPVAEVPPLPISPPQERYLIGLMLELGLMPNNLARNSYLSRELGREIRYLDEIKKHEASRLLSTLEAMKKEKERERVDGHRDDRDEEENPSS